MEATSFANRTKDGDGAFQTAADASAEDATARTIERVWGCELRRWGKFAPLDWYAVRGEQLIGVAELKVRSHAHDRFPTVFLSIRKWLGLLLAANGLAVPGLFIVRFEDGIRSINVSRVDAAQVRMAHARRHDAGFNDNEPVIEVPVGEMKVLER